METNGSNSNSHENQHPEISNDACKDSSTEKLNFINHGGWTTTYEDLLCSTDPFHQPIPLAEMVNLLVDSWHEDGLYD
ncbi:hypothetical protein WN944_003557 [Citrus x changshan-huyou]|uniref:Gag1-like clamp domain-containing protein n=1 Tax=Citrus x changshan-huyou TaxID=2935761 RepID=A0AAP0M4Z6_9ROSI